MYDKRDCLVVAGTGFGKSLVYQFPPVFLKKIAIVVSPLISLIDDQILALQRKGIKACSLSSYSKDLDSLNLKKFQVVYLTPEFFHEVTKLSESPLDAVKDRICLVAIDECHCITQWGSDFRPTFRQLSQFKSILPGVPIVGLTATATEICQDDVCASLQLFNPLVVKANLDRPNLVYTALPRGQDFIRDVKDHLLDVASGAVIIYVLRRWESEQFAQALNREGFFCESYNAGQPDEHRSRVVKAFADGNLRIIVATIAFGMGIDRPDVRAVIHYGSPKNLETYYQEVGRAGRDGSPSKGIIFWDQKDFDFHRFFLSKSSLPDGFKLYCGQLLERMQSFLTSTNCRRSQILQHLDASTPQTVIRESCCDNCTKTLHRLVPLHKMYREIDSNGQMNVSDDSRVLLKLVMAYQGKCVESESLKFLMGEMPTKPDKKHPLELFAGGKRKPKAWWAKLMQILVRRNFISRHTEVLHIPDEELLSDDDNMGEPYEFQFVVRRNDFLKIRRKGIKLLRRQTMKARETPTAELFRYLTKTNREFFIESGKIKSKARDQPKQIKKAVTKPNAASDELFKFQFHEKKPKKSEDDSRSRETVNIGASSSNTAKKEDETNAAASEDLNDGEDDEYRENVQLIRRLTSKPLKVEIDDFCSFLENFDERQLNELSCSPKTLTRDESKSIEMQANDITSLKRHKMGEDENAEFPLKKSRKPEETAND